MTTLEPTAIRHHIESQPKAAELGALLEEMFRATIQVGPDLTIPLLVYRSALTTAATILGCSVSDLVEVYGLRLTL